MLDYRTLKTFLTTNPRILFPWENPREIIGVLEGYAEFRVTQGLRAIVYYHLAQQMIHRLEPLAQENREKLTELEAERDKLQGEQAAIQEQLKNHEADWKNLTSVEQSVGRDAWVITVRKMKAELQSSHEKLVTLQGEVQRLADCHRGQERLLQQLRAIEPPGPEAVPGLREWLTQRGT